MLDVADLEACQQVCRDIDIVVHLAATTNPEAEFYPSLLHNNICGTYNIFRTAKDQRCQRVIFASSAQVFAGYPDDVQAHPGSPPRPMNMYGVCKCFGETVASYFAHAEGLSSIALRIGSYDVDADASNWLRQQPNARHLSGYVSERDLNHLLVRCIEAPDVPFAIVHAISNNRFKRLDITSTRDLFGYAPHVSSVVALSVGESRTRTCSPRCKSSFSKQAPTELAAPVIKIFKIPLQPSAHLDVTVYNKHEIYLSNMERVRSHFRGVHILKYYFSA